MINDAVPPIEFVGFVAAFFTTGSFLPQAKRTWRIRDTGAISLSMYAMMAIGNVLWVIYAIAINSLSLILANAVSLALVTIILALKVRHG
jgi:MtN3 and saliva related transmembrane protein